MVFNSFTFVIFFIVVTVLYFVLPYKYRWFMLLIASCYFYMSFVPVYILILFFTIIIDYFAGILIEKTNSKFKKVFLVASLITNIGTLVFFKYWNFIADNINTLLNGMDVSKTIPILNIILPIGLSFHTFQAMSYTIEVYRGKQKAEKHIGIYALYVMFYPQLVAGPIERPQNILYQFRKHFNFNSKNCSRGLSLMLWGLFKKVVIADRLSIYVDSVFNNAESYSGLTLWIATIFFAIQIYCDFSGYTDIAIGCAKIMGFKLMKNFNRPYFSKSISEFWSRWHISLSTWFRDYLYIPLGGNRVSIPRWFLNQFIVFLISGLWHGANWTYIVWGAINGIYLICGIIWKKVNSKYLRPLSIKNSRLTVITNTLFTFLLICISWVFFRAKNINVALYILKKEFTELGSLSIVSASLYTYCILGAIILFLVELAFEVRPKLKFSFLLAPTPVKYAVYTLEILLLLLIGVFDGGQFIYFQF